MGSPGCAEGTGTGAECIDIEEGIVLETGARLAAREDGADETPGKLMRAAAAAT